MESDPRVSRDAIRWLIGAGAAAVLLSVFLFWVDVGVMSKAPQREHEHNEHLVTLRTAQDSLPGRVSDPRQTLPLELAQRDSALVNGSAKGSKNATAYED